MIDFTSLASVILSERYCLKRVLGAGSYGKVCLAFDLKEQTEVAAKLINYNDLPPSLKAIQNEEISLLKSIKHPNIVGILDSYHDAKQAMLCIILPFFPRGDLARLIRHNRANPIPEDQIWHMLSQLASALHYLHNRGNGTQRGIIHRDIKPANILVDDRLGVHLTDFGIFRYIEVNSKALTFAGTRCYMAPEQLYRQAYDYKVDMWALGVTLYELMCRKTLFKLSDDEFIRKSLKTIPPLIDAIQGYSPDLKDVLRRLLTIPPEQRISSSELCEHPIVKEFAALSGMGKAAAVTCRQPSHNLHVTAQGGMKSVQFGQLKIPTGDTDDMELDALDRTPIMRCAIFGDPIVLDQKYLRCATSHGVTALMFAAAYGNTEAVGLLIPYEAQMIDSDGLSAIFYAVYAGVMDAVKMLLPAESMMLDDRACTPLVTAARQGRADMIDVFIPYMAGKQGRSGWTALMAAASSNNTTCVHKLVAKEAGLIDNHGETALMKAARCDSVEALEALMPYEGHIVRRDGKTALMSAAELGKNNVLKLLLNQAGQAKNDGTTALMFAAKNGNLEAVELLLPLERGMQNSQGITALIEAIQACQPVTAYYLAHHEKHICDYTGVYPLLHAQAVGMTELYEALTLD